MNKYKARKVIFYEENNYIIDYFNIYTKRMRE